MDTKKTEEMNDIERAKQADQAKDLIKKQEKEKQPDEKEQIKELYFTLMEEKSHEIKYLELHNKQIKDKIMNEYSSLPPDLPVAKKRLFELENLIKNMKSAITDKDQIVS